jgi:hypothetical protein
MSVRVFRYDIMFDRDDGLESVEVTKPQMARFIVTPDSTEKVLRDVMFLDDDVLIVVGSSEGTLLSFTNELNYGRKLSANRICFKHCC